VRRAEAYRLSVWKGVFYLLVATGLVLTVVRFTRGLGSVTNLSDEFPWGLWIGFDVLCGVGLAAGGFTIATVVHVLNLKRFAPILRPTILTAFLGYLLVVVALLFDLGRPWNLWHPLVMWNPHSVMFEVAWCVMLYTTVLALEFSEIVFEKLGWTRVVRWQHAAMLPLVVAGVILSTLHQSSLGAVYLIVPGKLHALWYTPRLPWIFYASSVCVGLAMVIAESSLSARAFNRKLELHILRDVGRALTAALAFFTVFRLWDLWDRGMLATAFSVGYAPSLFQLEFLLGLLLPLGLLASPKIRARAGGLYAASLLVILGFITNRLNVSITGLEAGTGGRYMPAWSEVTITLMLVAVGFALFGLSVRYLDVYPKEEPDHVVQDALAGGAVPLPVTGVR
jgi:Ni/Fe-hydrogenase subunit HybB-like protein